MNDSLPIIDCEGCCSCCMNIGHPHFWRFATGEETDPYWTALPPHLKDEINSYVDGLQDHDMDRPCIWLDLESQTCRHYDYRPQMCRDFEVGGTHCRRLRARDGVA